MIAAVAMALLFYFYFVWRVVRSVRRRMPIQTEVSWLTFLTACGVLSPLFGFVSLSRTVAAAVLVAALVIVVAVNLYIFRRYEKWLQKQNKTE